MGIWSEFRKILKQSCLNKSGLPPEWSFVRWSFIMVVFYQYQYGLSSGWSFIRWSFIRVVSHQGCAGWLGIKHQVSYLLSHEGGFSSGGLSSVWSPIRVVFHQGGLPLRWTYIRVVSRYSGLPLEWSFIRGFTIHIIIRVRKCEILVKGFLEEHVVKNPGRLQICVFVCGFQWNGVQVWTHWGPVGLRMPLGTETGQIRKCATKFCAASSVCSGTLNVLFFVFF